MREAKRRGRALGDYLDFSRDTLQPRWLQRPWGKLCVREAGSGPVLVVLHGLGGSGRYWEGLARQVSDRFSVVAIDMAGFGQSAKPWMRYDDLDMHLGNIDAALAGAEDVTVVGHSLGGLLAATWAARNPARVSSLALIAAPYPRPASATGKEPAEADREQDQAGFGPWLYARMSGAWQVLFRLPIRTPTYSRAIIQDYLRNNRHSYRSNTRLAWKADLPPQLAPLGQLRDRRKLLLYGEADQRVAHSGAEKYHQLMPDAELRVIPGAGHQLLLETNFEPLASWLKE